MPRGISPLPKDAFAQLPVTDKQVAANLQQVHRLIDDVLAEYDNFAAYGSALYHQQPWKTTAKSSELRVCRKKDALLPRRVHYRVFGVVPGDYRQMIEFLHAETSAAFFECQRIMFPDIVDAGSLADMTPAIATLAEQPQTRQCMGIRWLLAQPMRWEKLYTSFLEYTAVVHDRGGLPIGVRVNIPHDAPQVDQVLTQIKAKRFDHTVVQLLLPMPDKPGHTAIFMVYQQDHPHWMPVLFDRALLGMAKNLTTFATSRRIVQAKLLPSSEWAPRASRRDCAVCRRVFSRLRTRHHCRLCGEVICRHCTIRHDAPHYIAGDAADASAAANSAATAAPTARFRLRKTKFCVLCLTTLRDTPPDLLAGLMQTRATALSRISAVGRASNSDMTDGCDTDTDAALSDADIESTDTQSFSTAMHRSFSMPSDLHRAMLRQRDVSSFHTLPESVKDMLQHNQQQAAEHRRRSMEQIAEHGREWR